MIPVPEFGRTIIKALSVLPVITFLSAGDALGQGAAQNALAEKARAHVVAAGRVFANELGLEGSYVYEYSRDRGSQARRRFRRRDDRVGGAARNACRRRRLPPALRADRGPLMARCGAQSGGSAAADATAFRGLAQCTGIRPGQTPILVLSRRENHRRRLRGPGAAIAARTEPCSTTIRRKALSAS